MAPVIEIVKGQSRGSSFSFLQHRLLLLGSSNLLALEYQLYLLLKVFFAVLDLVHFDVKIHDQEFKSIYTVCVYECVRKRICYKSMH